MNSSELILPLHPCSLQDVEPLHPLYFPVKKQTLMASNLQHVLKMKIKRIQKVENQPVVMRLN